MKYCFIILHYKVAEVTSESIKCICKSSENYDYNIIVVDNASCNGSLEILEKEFETNTKINFVKLERNIGFAKGNNAGYLLAKNEFKADYIIILNNDVFISQIDFCEKINNLYEEVEFDILGPDIITRDNLHQNPLQECIKSYNELKKAILITRVKLLLMPFYNVKKRYNKRIYTGNPKYKISEVNVPLHGACLIFSKKYIENHEFAFYPETFLYAEEDILFYLAQKEKLRLLYSSEIEAFHNEDMATNEICKTEKDKRYFQLNNSLKSLLIFKELMKKDKKA